MVIRSCRRGVRYDLQWLQSLVADSRRPGVHVPRILKCQYRFTTIIGCVDFPVQSPGHRRCCGIHACPWNSEWHWSTKFRADGNGRRLGAQGARGRHASELDSGRQTSGPRGSGQPESPPTREPGVVDSASRRVSDEGVLVLLGPTVSLPWPKCNVLYLNLTCDRRLKQEQGPCDPSCDEHSAPCGLPLSRDGRETQMCERGRAWFLCFRTENNDIRRRITSMETTGRRQGEGWGGEQKPAGASAGPSHQAHRGSPPRAV